MVAQWSSAHHRSVGQEDSIVGYQDTKDSRPVTNDPDTHEASLVLIMV